MTLEIAFAIQPGKTDATVFARESEDVGTIAGCVE